MSAVTHAVATTRPPARLAIPHLAPT